MSVNQFSLSEYKNPLNNFDRNQIMVFEGSLTAPTINSTPIATEGLILAFVTQGEGHIGIDLNEYPVQTHNLIIIQSRSYFWFKKPQPNIKVSVIISPKEILNSLIPKVSDLIPLLLQHRHDPIIKLSEGNIEIISEYFEFIMRRFHDPVGKLTNPKTVTLLKSLLYTLLNFRSLSEEKGKIHKSTRQEDIMAKFIMEVGENFKENRQVNYYAEKLCITPKHLSTVIKSVSGLTAGEWIDQYVIMEAKILLRSSKKSIQQISQELNFKNQSFFGKYFKHITGLTPSEFRQV